MNFRVGDWLIEPERNLMLRNGNEAHLTPKAMDLLVFLAKRQGDVVSRDQILQGVWDGAAVTDDAITRCVGELRRSFNDDTRSPAVLETIPRRGYRLIAETNWNLEAQPRVEAPLHGLPTPRPAHSRWLLTSLALLAIVALTGLTRLPMFRRGPQVRSLVVLPLDDLSPKREDYFADGLTEALITELAQIRSLRVISRTSAMRYRDSGKGIPEIARELSVDAVVEGSVVRDGTRVRITAQLIHALTDSHLWSGTFDRSLGDILSLHSDIARSIAAELRITLTPAEQGRLRQSRPVSPAAYESFLIGKHFFSRSQFRQAADSFEQATKADPNFALAYAMLSEADSMIQFSSEQRAGERTFRAMQRARELDDSLAEVHMNLGDKLFYYDWDWAAGEAEFRRAVELDPASADAASHYAMCLHVQTRWDEALNECRRALRLDPVSPRLYALWIGLLIDSRKYEDAMTAFQRLVLLEPNLPGPWRLAARIHQHAGRDQEAAAALLKSDSLSGLSPAELSRRDAAVRSRGLRGYWNSVLEDTLRQSSSHPIRLAAIQIQAGNSEDAIRSLETAFRDRVPALVWIKARSTWDPLRSHVRFQNILRQMRLGP